MGTEWRPSNWGDEVTLEYGKAIRGYNQTHGKYRVFGSNGPIGWTSNALTQGPGVVLGRKGAYRGIEFCHEPFLPYSISCDDTWFIHSKYGSLHANCQRPVFQKPDPCPTMGLSPAGAAFSSQCATSLDRLGSASIQREIDRLEAAGLIEVERIANLRCLKANPESPVYGEFRSLVEKTIGAACLRELWNLDGNGRNRFFTKNTMHYRNTSTSIPHRAKT